MSELGNKLMFIQDKETARSRAENTLELLKKLETKQDVVSIKVSAIANTTILVSRKKYEKLGEAKIIKNYLKRSGLSH